MQIFMCWQEIKGVDKSDFREVISIYHMKIFWG